MKGHMQRHVSLFLSIKKYRSKPGIKNDALKGLKGKKRMTKQSLITKEYLHRQDLWVNRQ